MALKRLIPLSIVAQILALGFGVSEGEQGLRVVAIDRRTGEAAAEVTVRLEGDGGSWEAETDGLGVARFHGIRAGVLG